MSRNGSGTYTPPTNSWSPAVNGVSATAADWQAILNDLASALTQSLSADGQTALTGNLVANNNKITGLAAGTATGDSLRWQQLFSQGLPTNIASATTTDIGAVNSTVLTVTGTTTITSFGTNYNGPRFLRFADVLVLTNGASLVLPTAANITTAAGDTLIAVPLGSPASGWQVVAYQRATGVPLAGGAVPASETVAGIVELATVAETQTGTDNTRAVTPSSLNFGLNPVGTVIWHAANTAPSGYLKANGALVSRTTYAALFAAIGTTFGAGDGSTTFALPDLRGEFVRGWDDGRGVDSGRVFGSAQAGDIAGHNHLAGVSFQNTSVAVYASSTSGLPGSATRSLAETAGAGANQATTSTTGGTETRPRNIALLACIKF